LVRFGFRRWEIIDFKAISAAENSNKFQRKPRFWKEKSVEAVVTLGANGTGHTSHIEKEIDTTLLILGFENMLFYKVNSLNPKPLLHVTLYTNSPIHRSY
jgi:hypothetical protein